MKPLKSNILLTLPDWLLTYSATWKPGGSIEKRMQFVIKAAEQNVLQQSGGPFAAAIFERESGELISIGVNLVTSHNNAILHAEVVAIMLAQQTLQTFDLGHANLLPHELVTSSEPCAMCIGASNWSGVHRLIYAATIADAQAIGFDEGPVSPTWREEFAHRGIEILPEIERESAVKVLNLYKTQGGLLYNGGQTRKK